MIDKKTGWPPPELMQDDCKELSRWFATRLDITDNAVQTRFGWKVCCFCLKEGHLAHSCLKLKELQRLEEKGKK